MLHGDAVPELLNGYARNRMRCYIATDTANGAVAVVFSQTYSNAFTGAVSALRPVTTNTVVLERAEDFDRYSDMCNVPPIPLINRGISLPCDECGKPITYKSLHGVVVDGDGLLCGKACAAKHTDYDMDFAIALMEQSVLNTFPDVTINYTYVSFSAESAVSVISLPLDFPMSQPVPVSLDSEGKFMVHLEAVQDGLVWDQYVAHLEKTQQHELNAERS